MPITTQSEHSQDSVPANLFAVRAPDLKNDGYPSERSSAGKRAFISLLIIFCIGVSVTFALQWHGDTVMSATSFPHPSGLPPQAEPVPQNAPDVIGLTSRRASSLDQHEPNPMSLDLGAVRQSINQIAASIASSQGRTDRMTATQDQIARTIDRMAISQEQMTRSLDQLTADREQMTREITKLQEIDQSIRSKNSQPSPRPVSASAFAPKPVSRPAFASTPKPISPTPTLPEPTMP